LVPPIDGSNNWGLVGGTGITVTGNAGAGTLTIASIAASNTISGNNTAVLVPPIDGANNWGLIGTNQCTVTGNAATGILTIDVPAAVQLTISGNNTAVLVPPVDGANNWGLIGKGGITVFGTAGTGILTITGSDVWIDQGSSIVMQTDTNYFAIAAITLTMPAVPQQGDRIRVYVDTASSVIIAASGGQTLRMGTATSTVGGTLTNSFQGDSVWFVYRAADTTWMATSFVGTFQPA
jgi:hypothetical protein